MGVGIPRKADAQASWQRGQSWPWWAGEAFKMFIYSNSNIFQIPNLFQNFYLFQFLLIHYKLVNFTL